MNNQQLMKIWEAVKADRKNYPSQAAHARALGINTAVYSILNGAVDEATFENKMNPRKWVEIARNLNVELKEEAAWATAFTPTYQYIVTQLDRCRDWSTAGLFCDKAGIGKTHAAREYARTHANVAYIDCSIFKTKQKFVRALAQAFGMDSTGRLKDVIEDLSFYVKSLETPLIILDEAGDLEYPAFLEVKALYNAMEGIVGWYMMGADGLEAKIKRCLNYRKVGYAEIFDRFGARYQQLVPGSQRERDEFFRTQAKAILTANLPDGDHETLMRRCEMSLRRLKLEVQKIKSGGRTPAAATLN